MNIYFSILLGSLGLFLGHSNPLGHFPFLALLYPTCLYFVAFYSQNALRDSFLMTILGGTGVLYWAAVAVYSYASFPLILAIPCAVLGAIYLSIWSGLFVFIIKYFQELNPFGRAFMAGLLWCILEYARSFGMFGFPWATVSSAFAVWPIFIQSLSLIGSFALSGIFVGLACLIAESFFLFYGITKKAYSRLYTLSLALIPCLSFLLIGFGGHFYLQKSLAKELFINPETNQQYSSRTQYFHQRENSYREDIQFYFHRNPQKTGMAQHSFIIPSSEQYQKDKDSILISLVQGNISQALKWHKSLIEATVDKYLRLSLEADVFLRGETRVKNEPIFIFPETAFPFYYEIPSKLSRQIDDFAQDNALFFGAPGTDLTLENSLYNRLHFIQNSQHTFYDKKQLVPFGEFIPPLPLPEIVRNILMSSVDYLPGDNDELIKIQKNDTLHPVASLICYEAIFPQIAREQVAKGAEILINISNDAWYNKSSAPTQHLHLSLMRAVEQNRFMARVSNTGISAFIDPYGQIMAQTPLFVDASLSGYVQFRREKTLFFHIEPYILPVCLILFLLCTFYIKRSSFFSKKEDS